MTSRCIFFFSAFRACSTLLSRTRTCTLAPSLVARTGFGQKARKGRAFESGGSSRTGVKSPQLPTIGRFPGSGRQICKGASVVAARGGQGRIGRRNLFRQALGLAVALFVTPRLASAQTFTASS